MNNRNYRTPEKSDFNRKYNRSTNHANPYLENRNHPNNGRLKNTHNYDERNYDLDNRYNSDYFQGDYMSDYENDDDFHRYDPHNEYFRDDSQYFDHDPYGRRDHMLSYRDERRNNWDREDYDGYTNDHQNSEPHYVSRFIPSTRNRVNINEENSRNNPYPSSLNSHNYFEGNNRYREDYPNRNTRNPEYIPRYMDNRYSDYRDNRDRVNSDSRRSDTNENRRRAGFGGRMRD